MHGVTDQIFANSTIVLKGSLLNAAWLILLRVLFRKCHGALALFCVCEAVLGDNAMLVQGRRLKNCYVVSRVASVSGHL